MTNDMRRVLLFAFIATIVSVLPVRAQFLKKLGKAIDKVGQTVEKVEKAGRQAAGDLGLQLGKAVQIGDMTMTAYGDNPGIGFNFGYCYRENGKVLLVFQLPNQGQKDIENVCIRNYEPDETAVIGTDGQKYGISLVALGESRSSEGLSKNIPAGQFVNGVIVIDVPEGVRKLGKVIFRSTGQYPMDATVHRYAFVLSNVTVTDNPPTQENGSQENTYARPAEGWMLTANGVGPFVPGAKVEALPDKVDGLYNKIEGDTGLKYVYLGDTHVMNLTVADGTVAGIQLVGDVVGVKVSGKVFRVGGDSDLLKKQSGVKSVSYSDDADYNGIHFTGYESEIQQISIGKN